MAWGGKNIGSNRPNWHTFKEAGMLGTQDEWADIPHHWQRMPVKHSADPHVFLHLTHLEVVGRFTS